MVAWIFGWGDAAFPDHTGGFFFVYILAPIVGGILAGLFFTYVLQKLMQLPVEGCCCCKKKN
jgi:glycerol uptake facilitator protein